MSDDYRLFEVHYSMYNSGGDRTSDFVNYGVARSPEEARELSIPHLERLKRNLSDSGFRGVEMKIRDIREMNIDHTGWRIRLEKIVDPSAG